jgi:hypothetical protein
MAHNLFSVRREFECYCELVNASDRRPTTKNTDLGQVEAGDFGAAQPGAQDQVHDGPVAQRPGVPVHGRRGVAAAVAAAAQLVEPFDPVEHVLDRAYLWGSR